MASRAGTTYNVVASMRDAYATTLSHIVDVDFAEEAANLARTRILQEMATSLLAQANLQPRIALALL